jgi:hypothetical protein
MKSTALLFVGISLLIPQFASATACGDFIYKHGKFRKYEYMNNTASENTKKHGSSTTSAATTEGSTASSDPGVSTGVSESHQQSSSSKGECKLSNLFASKEEFREYLAQNTYEIKHEISLGKGGHLEILAAAFSCTEKGNEALSKVLQKNIELFVDYEPSQSREFADSLKLVVEKNLGQHCHAI